MSRTLLALLVPDAEPLVGDLRMRLDPAARLGLGAHVTLLYPFHDTNDIDPLCLARLDTLVASHPPLRFRLAETGTFPSTVWLAPSPAEGMAALAAALEKAFPGRPQPQRGRASGHFVPHLSVARNVRRLEERQAIEAVMRERLARPVECFCDRVHVMARTAGGWTPVHVAALKR